MPHEFVAMPTQLGNTTRTSPARQQAQSMRGSEQYQRPENWLEVEVRNPRTQGKSRTMYTDYEIVLSSNIPIFHQHSVVRRRYSDFVAFKDAIERDVPRVHVPSLPPKVFTNRFSEEVIKSRTVQLDRFLQQIASHPLVQTGAARLLASFLQDEIWIKDDWVY